MIILLAIIALLLLLTVFYLYHIERSVYTEEAMQRDVDRFVATKSMELQKEMEKKDKYY